MKYIDVIIPLPLAGTFTYLVPDGLEDSVRIGMRVVVPFGVKKMYTGIITLLHTHKPELYEPKEIICLLDSEPILRRPQLKFWEWIGEYYMAFPGDVYQAAVPAGLKLESETLVTVNPDFEAESVLSAKEQLVLDILSEGKPVSVNELTKAGNFKDVMPVLKKLLDKHAVEIRESVAEKFHARKQAFVRVHAEVRSEEGLRRVFDQIQKTPKQLALLMKLIDVTNCLRPIADNEVSKKEFLEKSGCSEAVLQALVKKSIVEIYDKIIGRLDMSETETASLYGLNSFQQQAKSEIEHQFVEKQVVLLHGVTSSGKTEIYAHLIDEVLKSGKQVLYLVPEIALTTQLTTRLKRVFGNKLGVYHSKFSDAERVEVWNNMLKDENIQVILGVRSSIFLPFRQLGMVIIDEEHEPSYKQYDPSPRYHARNAAIVLASMHAAKVLLGTATPSIESYYNAVSGKYGLVKLTTRHEELELPEIEIIDTKDAYKRKMMEGNFSDQLLLRIREALARKEQVILFQNRRGYSPYLECKACAYIPKCKHCDVSLTYHQHVNSLNCHYCGYTEPYKPVCPVCNTPGLQTRGFGTEKIESDIQQIFPEARISRMDLDTTRNKKSYAQIITDFELHKVDILVGTQMVTKGLDFEKVSLVGILNADNMLNFPDFRAFERAYQLMAQVSGRAGRKNKRGKVVLQTNSPDHPVIHQVIRNDYEALFNSQCEERMQFKYPPFYRMIQIELKHKELDKVLLASKVFANMLQQVFSQRVAGPVVPSVSRVQNMYIRYFVLKIEMEASPSKAKALLKELVNQLLSDVRFRTIRIQMDVDPN